MSELTKAYQRGYNAGKKRSFGYVDRIIKIARSYRARLRSTELERFGNSNWMSRTCSTCVRWTRGGERCHWGVCGGKFLTEVGEPAMWSNDAIDTHEDFGCVSWLHPANELRKPFSEMKRVAALTREVLEVGGK